MSIKQTLTRFQILEAGEYPAVLTSIDEGEGEHGLFWIWTFTVSEGPAKGEQVSGVTSTTYSTYPSKSYKWASALGHNPETDFDADAIISESCRVIVDVIDKDGQERNKVANVLAPSKKGIFN